MSDSVRPHRWQPTRLPLLWDSPGKKTGVCCHFLQCMKVKSESEVTQSCLTLRNPMDCSPPGSSIHEIFQARVLEWGAIAFSISRPLEGETSRSLTLRLKLSDKQIGFFHQKTKDGGGCHSATSVLFPLRVASNCFCYRSKLWSTCLCAGKPIF